MCSYVSVKEMNVIDVYLNRNRYYGHITLIFVFLQSIYHVFFGHLRPLIKDQTTLPQVLEKE